MEDTVSSAIIIEPTANQGITHFRITGIAGGTLVKNNEITPILNGGFISVADGLLGIKFLPALNSNVPGHFDVELSQNGTSVVAGSSKATSTINVTPVGDTPQDASVGTLQNTLSEKIIINRNASDGPEVTHFPISGITGGTLFRSNGVTPIADGSYIPFAEAQLGVRFLPALNSVIVGRFDVESSQSGTTVAAQSGKATSTITVTPYELPSLSIGDVVVSEGNATAIFIVTLSKACSHPVTVRFATANGSATTDFTSISGLLTFAPGETFMPITVLLKDDFLDEVDETFFVILSSATAAGIGDPYAKATTMVMTPLRR